MSHGCMSLQACTHSFHAGGMHAGALCHHILIIQCIHPIPWLTAPQMSADSTRLAGFLSPSLGRLRGLLSSSVTDSAVARSDSGAPDSIVGTTVSVPP